MITSTIALQSADDPQFTPFLIWAGILLFAALVLGMKYSRLFDSGRTNTLGMEIVTGLCGGLGLVALACALW